jgi:hypothetical protein
MRPYNKIINKAEHLLRELKIESEKTGQYRGIPIEIYKNYCLNYVEQISKLKNITKNQRFEGRKRIFNVYFKLQEYEGPERQTKRGREIPFSALQSANAYKGGLGFSGISDGLFLQSSGPKVNQYWKPPPKSKVKTAPSSVHDWLMEDYEERRPLTLDEFHEEMNRQKREVLYEMRKLRETPDTGKRRIFIL